MAQWELVAALRDVVVGLWGVVVALVTAGPAGAVGGLIFIAFVLYVTYACVRIAWDFLCSLP